MKQRKKWIINSKYVLYFSRVTIFWFPKKWTLGPVMKSFNNTVCLKKTLTYSNNAFFVQLMNVKIKNI